MTWIPHSSETPSGYDPKDQLSLAEYAAMSVSYPREDMVTINDILNGSEFEVEIKRLVIAGFTGRSSEEVEKHIEELKAAGVEAPPRIPAIYLVDRSLLTTAPEISVEGDQTSGEIEPVVLRAKGNWFLLAGSDHTDRALEASSIQASKEACPKVIGAECFPVEAIQDWDSLQLSSWLDDDASTLYQEGTLSRLLPLDAILASVVERIGPIEDGDVVFLGTIPVRQGKMQPSDAFSGEIRLGPNGERLSLTYRVQVSAEGTI